MGGTINPNKNRKNPFLTPIANDAPKRKSASAGDGFVSPTCASARAGGILERLFLRLCRFQREGRSGTGTTPRGHKHRKGALFVQTPNRKVNLPIIRISSHSALSCPQHAQKESHVCAKIVWFFYSTNKRTFTFTFHSVLGIVVQIHSYSFQECALEPIHF
jgi:hypothetical protein